MATLKLLSWPRPHCPPPTVSPWSTNTLSQRGTAPRLPCRSVSSRVMLNPRREFLPGCAFPADIAAATSRRHGGKQGTVRTASNLNGDQGIVGAEQEALEQQKLAQTEVGETVIRAEAKVRVAAAAASAAGFAVEVAKQQGASEEATEAVGKAAEAVAKVALKAAKAVKRVQDNVAKSSDAAVTEQEDAIQREIERERTRYTKEGPERDL